MWSISKALFYSFCSFKTMNFSTNNIKLKCFRARRCSTDVGAVLIRTEMQFLNIFFSLSISQTIISLWRSLNRFSRCCKFDLANSCIFPSHTNCWLRAVCLSRYDMTTTSGLTCDCGLWIEACNYILTCGLSRTSNIFCLMIRNMFAEVCVCVCSPCAWWHFVCALFDEVLLTWRSWMENSK